MTAYLVHPFVLIRNTLKKATIAVMPLFLDSGPSVTMIKHSMITSKKAIQYLSSDQLPVVAMDHLNTQTTQKKTNNLP